MTHDVTSLILCLLIVLGLFSIQYSPGPPLLLTNNMLHYDQQIQYAIFLGVLCNILTNNIQFLTNNYNMQFCTLDNDIPPLSLFLHHAYRSNLHEFMKVKHGQPLELVYKPCNTFWPHWNRKLTWKTVYKDEESKNTRVTVPIFFKRPKAHEQLLRKTQT